MNHTTTAMVAANPTTITTASVTDAPYPALALATQRSAPIGIAIALALLGVLVLAACSGSPGRLTADRRVKIQEPKPGSTVTEPVVLRWSSTFEPGAASGLWFVVYVDVAMIPPGQSALVDAHEPCDTVAACMEHGELDGPNTFLTDQHSITLEPLPPGAGPQHRFTIVLVDDHGIRQGGVAWNATFWTEPH